MATDDVTDVVLSAAVCFEIFGTEITNSDKDAKEPLGDADNGRGTTGFSL